MNKNDFEWGFDKIEFKVHLDDEINVGEFKRIVIPFIFIVTVVCALFTQSWILFFCGIFWIVFYFVVICVCGLLDKIKQKHNVTQAEHRKRTIYATIIKIECEPDVDFDYVRIVAQYMFENGEIKTFKTKRIIGKAICNLGDKIEVLIDDYNHNNYEINTLDCIM